MGIHNLSTNMFPVCSDSIKSRLPFSFASKRSTDLELIYSLQLELFNWWVSFAPEFQFCYFCEPSCLFYLSFNFDFYVSKIMHL